ncbi:hypothetical protein [Candidatus Palauibacter irciniicola]|uniref:hypothetical protein n=1 Tax=Candidatus Palauibacter irciniicola TaxID=3056733 RepID=UPI003B026C5A
MNELDAAIAEWHRVREEIAADDEERLWQKLRLEWNYNSNHIEGNTLTYARRSCCCCTIRSPGPTRCATIEEMKAHNVAIGHSSAAWRPTSSP